MLVVRLPCGKVELTVNGVNRGKERKIVRFELLPMQAQSLALEIREALDPKVGQ
jgi:hypothetical protein